VEQHSRSDLQTKHLFEQA
jgi:hypothetical protein